MSAPLGELPAPATRKPRYGDEFVVRIEGFDARGRAWARAGEYRFSMRAAPTGALVRAFVLKRRKNQIEAHVSAVLERGVHAADPLCAHFRACGGCSFQDLAYAEQLAGLQRLVDGALRARGLLEHVQVDPIEPASNLYAYRNKMEFTFSTRRWIATDEPANAPSGFALGLHAAGLHSKVIDVGRCPIQADSANAILKSARAEALRLGLEPWDLRAHTGLLRHLVLRVAGSTGEILVNLVSSSDAHELLDPYIASLVERHPEITTFVHNVNTRLGASAVGERERVVHGRGWIREVLDGVEFAVSANSFFQTNSLQAARLFEIVRAEAQLSGRELVYDLYSGTGTIALVLARAAHEVVGFELVPAAVADARANALRNGITNVRFVEGDVLVALDGAHARAPDVCVVDPPRAGLHPRLVPKLARLGAARIVYVSCNPQSAAVDVAALVAAGYRLVRVRPIDLFPHTPHVESVLRLERVS